MKRLILGLALAGCGGGEGNGDLHAVVTCERTDVQPTVRCERACAAITLMDGERCFASNPKAPDTTIECVAGTFEFEGVVGCCMNNTEELLFWECE